ncbi:hypothetical protein HDU76_009298 [Blyttiomyces sp. JEL0837]|nr:hypothetical protein HDU76_009298 [Blyttiomyces sp. JEL0837]
MRSLTTCTLPSVTKEENPLAERNKTFGLPLHIFHERGYAIDAVINTDTGNLDILDPDTAKALQLTTPDRVFMEEILDAVMSTWKYTESTETDHMDTEDVEGSDTFVRTKFEMYLLSLLATVKVQLPLSQSEDEDIADAALSTMKAQLNEIGRSIAPVQATIGKALTTAEASLSRAVTSLADPEQQKAFKENVGKALSVAENTIGNAITTAETSIGKALESAENTIGKAFLSAESSLGQAFTTAETSISKAVTTLINEDQQKAISDGASRLWGGVSSLFAKPVTGWGLWDDNATAQVEEDSSEIADATVNEDKEEEGYTILEKETEGAAEKQ